jgi:hypothetical protein
MNSYTELNFVQKIYRIKMSLYKKSSWPFKFNSATKHVRQQMDFWIVNVKDKPILLSKRDYDALMETLPREWLREGTPVYDGREIKRLGDD